MRMVTVLKTHLGAGWHDPSGGGRGRQASDIYRAGEQQWVRPTIATDTEYKLMCSYICWLNVEWSCYNHNTDHIPIKIPHHEVLELGWYAPVEARPRQQPVCLSILDSICLMAGLPLEVWITQGHTDVIQETRQRTQFYYGILWLKGRFFLQIYFSVI